MRNSAGKLGAGLDIRGEGGYVVAPPSNHVQGVYGWENWDEISELPREIRQAMAGATASGRTDHAFGQSRSNDMSAGKTKAHPGTRNSALASLAGSMRHKGFSQEAITQALLVENRQRCHPPLENEEVRDIARSISRYQPGESLKSIESTESIRSVESRSEEFGKLKESIISQASSDSTDSTDPLDSIDSLKVWNLNEFLNQTFETKENICFEAGKGDLVMVAARTNGGKSTLLRNCLLSLATGRKFGPFVPEQRPRRVLLLDFEADDAELQRDLAVMTGSFSLPERELLAENFKLIPKGIIGHTLFQLNHHFNFVHNIIKRSASEVVVIDNISAAFTLNDENNNAEVTGKIVKPLFKIAQASGAAVVFAHHIGKTSESARDDVYLGRGASTLACLAKTVFNLRGRVDHNEPVEICCVKRKNGHNYKRSFRLNPETRWFTPLEAATRKPTNYDLIVAWLRENAPPERPVKTGEIVSALPRIGRTSLMLNLRDAVTIGDVMMPQRAYYCAKPGRE